MGNNNFAWAAIYSKSCTREEQLVHVCRCGCCSRSSSESKNSGNCRWNSSHSLGVWLRSDVMRPPSRPRFDATDCAGACGLCVVEICCCQLSTVAFLRSRYARSLLHRAAQKLTGNPGADLLLPAPTVNDQWSLKSLDRGRQILYLGPLPDGSSVSSSEPGEGPFCAMHQHHVDGHAVQPGGECGIATKRRDFAMQLQKGFLSQIFRLCDIAQHAQTQRIHPALMHVVENLKGCAIALLGLGNRRQFSGDGRISPLLLLHRPGFCSKWFGGGGGGHLLGSSQSVFCHGIRMRSTLS